MTSSVAKVVQPTATVSSVPVSGPSKLNILIAICFGRQSKMYEQKTKSDCFIDWVGSCIALFNKLKN